MQRSLSAITTIAVHHTATPDDRPITVADIDAWHFERGFRRSAIAMRSHQPQLRSIGYHKVIYRDGTVADGRALDEVGAHAKGFNGASVGVCLVGMNRFTEAQWRALAAEVKALELQLRRPLLLRGHRDLMPGHTVCPGFDVAAWESGGLQPLSEHLS